MGRKWAHLVGPALGLALLAWGLVGFVRFFSVSSSIVVSGLEWIPFSPGVAHLIGPFPSPVNIRITSPQKLYVDESARVTATVDSPRTAEKFLIHGLPVNISLSLSG